MIEDFDGFFFEVVMNVVLVIDFVDFFGCLKVCGFKFGVVFSDNELLIWCMVDCFGFVVYFDYVVGYDSGYGCKLELGMVWGFVEVVGFEYVEILVVGDNSYDMMMG